MATACVNFTDDYPKAVTQVSILIVLMLFANHRAAYFRTRQQTKQKQPGMLWIVCLRGWVKLD